MGLLPGEHGSALLASTAFSAEGYPDRFLMTEEGGGD